MEILYRADGLATDQTRTVSTSAPCRVAGPNLRSLQDFRQYSKTTELLESLLSGFPYIGLSVQSSSQIAIGCLRLMQNDPYAPLSYD